MSNYQLYQEVLTHASEGTPLWEPGSCQNHPAPSFGDVGYLRFGAFIRLFNAMLPPGHPDNENKEPLNHVPYIANFSIVRSILPPGVVAASGVQPTGISHTETGAHIQFKCTDKAGAVVMSSSEVFRQDISSQSLGSLADYVMSHAHEWAEFARCRLKHEVALHELIFVTGCDITKGKYSVTVFNSARSTKKTDASFELSSPASDLYTWSHSPLIGHFQHNFGPRHRGHTTEQCLFVRGFKTLDRRVERSERQGAGSLSIKNCCDAQPRTPLDAVLRYLTDKSDADVAIVHDYDLARFLMKHDVSCDYPTLLKQLKKSRRPIVRRGNGTYCV